MHDEQTSGSICISLKLQLMQRVQSRMFTPMPHMLFLLEQMQLPLSAFLPTSGERDPYAS